MSWRPNPLEGFLNTDFSVSDTEVWEEAQAFARLTGSGVMLLVWETQLENHWTVGYVPTLSFLFFLQTWVMLRPL